MRPLADMELGTLVAEHHHSLPYTRQTGPALWIAWFYAAPAGAAALMWASFDTAGQAAAGLLAGVGVLGGLLFQVLAWVSGRLGSLADSIGDRPPTDNELALIGRLDIARANVAYASLLSIAFVAELGVLSLWNDPPKWMNLASAFLLFHLTAVLVLTLLRINRIGKSDRVAVLTAHARRERRH